jgi:hypothetical protein
MFQTNPSIHNINTNNKHHIRRPNTNLSCFHWSAFCADIKTLNSLPPTVTAPENEEAKCKAALRKQQHTNCFDCVDGLFVCKYGLYYCLCKMAVVFWNMNLHICVFMGRYTSCCSVTHLWIYGMYVLRNCKFISQRPCSYLHKCFSLPDVILCLTASYRFLSSPNNRRPSAVCEKSLTTREIVKLWLCIVMRQTDRLQNKLKLWLCIVMRQTDRLQNKLKFVLPFRLEIQTRSNLTVQYSTVQYSTVQYSTVQCSTVQYSTVQYSTV